MLKGVRDEKNKGLFAGSGVQLSNESALFGTRQKIPPLSPVDDFRFPNQRTLHAFADIESLNAHSLRSGQEEHTDSQQAPVDTVTHGSLQRVDCNQVLKCRLGKQLIQT